MEHKTRKSETINEIGKKSVGKNEWMKQGKKTKLMNKKKNTNKEYKMNECFHKIE